MPVQLLLATHSDQFAEFHRILTAKFTEIGVDVCVHREASDPESIDYIAYAPDGPIQDFRQFTRVKAILSLWAGIENLIRNSTVNCPVTRMVESGMKEGMTEWVSAQVLRHHLGLDTIVQSQDGVWRHELMPPLARNRTVAVLGLGELGSAAANTLKELNFQVIGWSRTAKSIPGIDCRHGLSGLESTVEEAEIIVVLLPHTAQTENLLDNDLLGKFKRGAVIINSGRGALIDEDALLTALDSGHIGHATLDVFKVEPLPANHPFWFHKSVTVSPHIAADTRAETAAEVIVENVRRGECGEPFLYLVDRLLGY